MSPCIRPASPIDLPALVELERHCFSSDRISQRSFKAFIRHGAHQLLVCREADKLLGYALLLFRRGTLLSRLYSLAVAPDQRGKGVAMLLLDAAEQLARDRQSVFLRLEVREDNAAAISLYNRRGYRTFGRVSDYYADGCSAVRMEKRLLTPAQRGAHFPHYYRQTTGFTCGPASLMMAMRDLDPASPFSRREELQIWREATSIYMGSGHGGCTPQGLMLAALRRKFNATLFISDTAPAFIDSVRSPSKRQLMQLVHDDFMAQLTDYKADIRVNKLDTPALQSLLIENRHVVALISTWALDRQRAPHWVYVYRGEENTVYINDPDSNTCRGHSLDSSKGHWQSEIEYHRVPISLEQFSNMASFGKRRLRCILTLQK